ncbi:MAG: extracellular solute-binding protein [Methanomicrobiaceae archaeon]|nr:extracellular solute-binding protein [Methanomicrobiaceae archaeon]
MLEKPPSLQFITGLCAILTLIGGALLVSGCVSAEREVVVYTSVDQVYAEQILDEFEEATGITVQAVYDVEATKTTGLVNRLIAEKDRPLADVFWNGEFMQTLLLKQKGVLTPYVAPAATDIPAQYRDPGGYWAGVGGRARILLVNTDLLSPGQYPDSITDLADETFPGDEIAIAYPMFGTSATHAAALYAAWGPEEARSFYETLQARGVRVVDGNSVVRDLVAAGEVSVGLTDTDDACRAVEDGRPVTIIVPDQEEGGLGTLVIPTTVALIANGPHPEEGKALVDFLLAKETEQRLMDIGWIQVSTRLESSAAPGMESGPIDGIEVTLYEVYDQLQPASRDLAGIFIR